MLPRDMLTRVESRADREARRSRRGERKSTDPGQLLLDGPMWPSPVPCPRGGGWGGGKKGRPTLPLAGIADLGDLASS